MKFKPSLSSVLHAFIVSLFLVLLTLSAFEDTDENETESTSYPYYLFEDIQPPPEFVPIEPITWEHLIDPSYTGTFAPTVEYKEHSYIITYSARLKSNNHVGDSWTYGLTYEGENIESGSIVECVGAPNLIVRAYAKEFDDYNDYGSTQVTFITLNIGEKQKREVTVTVRENKGRYKGNTAKWSFDITVERIS